MFIGTVQSQVNLQMNDLKWQQKKQDINNKKKTNLTKDQIMLQNLKDQADETRKSNKTGEIYNKLKSGGSLSTEEIAYLKEHDPEALADYEKAQMEKKAYEKAMKNCKTKEEVERLKFNKLGGYISEAKSIANNAYIPKAKKLELMNKLNNRVCLASKAYDEFVKSNAFKELPEEAELSKERIEEAMTQNEDMQSEQIDSLNDKTDVIDDDRIDGKAVSLVNELQTQVESKDETSMKEVGNTDLLGEKELLSFEKVNREIETFLRKNATSKPSINVGV